MTDLQCPLPTPNLLASQKHKSMSVKYIIHNQQAIFTSSIHQCSTRKFVLFFGSCSCVVHPLNRCEVKDQLQCNVFHGTLGNQQIVSCMFRGEGIVTFYRLILFV